MAGHRARANSGGLLSGAAQRQSSGKPDGQRANRGIAGASGIDFRGGQ